MISELESTLLFTLWRRAVRAVEEQKREKGIDRESELRESQYSEYVHRFATGLFSDSLCSYGCCCILHKI